MYTPMHNFFVLWIGNLILAPLLYSGARCTQLGGDSQPLPYYQAVIDIDERTKYGAYDLEYWHYININVTLRCLQTLSSLTNYWI
jgi:hypothetical protein